MGVSGRFNLKNVHGLLFFCCLTLIPTFKTTTSLLYQEQTVSPELITVCYWDNNRIIHRRLLSACEAKDKVGGSKEYHKTYK